MPHAWLGDNDNVVSSHDLIGPNGAFLLLTDEQGLEWIAAAKRVSRQYGILIKTAQIGPLPHLRDLDDQWDRVKEIRKGGAILVRPDNFVAWRSKDPSNSNGQEVEEAVRKLLGFTHRVAEVNGTHL